MGIQYPVIIGSSFPENDDGFQATNHWLLRNFYGDKRKWGTPTSLVFVDGNMENPYLFLGEISPATIDQFLNQNQ